MAFYSFLVGSNKYSLINLTEHVPIKDLSTTALSLESLSEQAKIFSLVHTNDDNQIIASIVGDCPEDYVSKKSSYTFVSFEGKISSVADKIAIQRTLQYLNNEEYKKL